MRIAIYILSLIFTFVSLGGNIYVHQCKESVLLSFYHKIETTNCQFCNKHHQQQDTQEDHCGGHCKDSVLKIDQLDKTGYTINQSLLVTISPAVLPIYGVMDFQIQPMDNIHTNKADIIQQYTNSSPPIFIKNCNFRI